MHLGEIQAQIEITPEELTEEDLMEMRASEPVPNDEKKTERKIPGNKLTLDNQAEGSSYSRLLLTLFNDMDPSIILALKLKQIMEGELVLY